MIGTPPAFTQLLCLSVLPLSPNYCVRVSSRFHPIIVSKCPPAFTQLLCPSVLPLSPNYCVWVSSLFHPIIVSECPPAFTKLLCLSVRVDVQLEAHWLEHPKTDLNSGSVVLNRSENEIYGVHICCVLCILKYSVRNFMVVGSDTDSSHSFLSAIINVGFEFSRLKYISWNCDIKKRFVVSMLPSQVRCERWRFLFRRAWPMILLRTVGGADCLAQRCFQIRV